MSKIVTIRVETEADVKALQKTNKVLKVTEEQAKSTRRQAKEVGKSLDKAGAEGKTGARGILEASRAFEDLQYGIRGILNNIPVTIQAFGGTAKAAGLVSFAAVGLDLAIRTLSSAFASLSNNVDTSIEGLVDSFKDFNEESDRAASGVIDNQDDVTESIRRATDAQRESLELLDELASAEDKLALLRAKNDPNLSAVGQAESALESELGAFDKEQKRGIDDSVAKGTGLKDTAESLEQTLSELSKLEEIAKDRLRFALESEVADQVSVTTLGSDLQRLRDAGGQYGPEEAARKDEAFAARERIENRRKFEEEEGKSTTEDLENALAERKKDRENAESAAAAAQTERAEHARSVESGVLKAAVDRKIIEEQGAISIRKAKEAEEKANARLQEKQNKQTQKMVDFWREVGDNINKAKQDKRDADAEARADAKQDADDAAKARLGAAVQGAGRIARSGILPDSITGAANVLQAELQQPGNEEAEFVELAKIIVNATEALKRKQSSDARALTIRMQTLKDQIEKNR